MRLIVAMLLGLSACQPSDVKVDSVRERLEAGETVTFNKPGTKLPNCGDDSPDWQDVRLRDDNERKRVVLETQQSIVNVGFRYCGRIGSMVAMNVNKNTAGKGLVRITSISLVKLDKLTPKHMKGQYFASNSDFDYYKSYIRPFPDNHGIVTVIDVEYGAGSAADEKSIREKAQQEEASDGYQETKKDGEALESCVKRDKESKKEEQITFTILEAPKKFHAPLLEGRVKSYFLIGNSCFRHGTQVGIAENRNDTPVGQVKIKKVKKFKIAHLTEDYFDNKPDFEALKEEIATSLKLSKIPAEAKKWLTLVELADEKSVGSECKPAFALKIVNGKSREDILAEKKWIVNVDGKTCFKAGDMIQVIFSMNNGEERMEVAAVVKNQFWSEESKTTMLDVELVQGERK